MFRGAFLQTERAQLRAALARSSVAVAQQQRFVAFTTPKNSDYPGHYNPAQKLVAGQDVSLRMTEFYDGYTDDFGVFKEGPPSTLRYEYIRAPDHLSIRNILAKHHWSPFEAGKSMKMYSPFYRDYVGTSARDQFGQRNGAMPGDRSKTSFYEKQKTTARDERNEITKFQQPRVPKWLALIVNEKFKKGLIGFFLYANGAYVAEVLTHKQLPRLTYGKPHLGYLPTLGQCVQLSEVTYGKEIHSIQMYHGHARNMCTAPGCAAIVLRGSEPNLVPLLLPSREVRLFDTVNYATFGRRAGLMSNRAQIYGRDLWKQYTPRRFKMRHISRYVGSWRNTGGNDKKRQPTWVLDWRELQAKKNKTKYFLSGYILRGRQYNRRRTATELKAKTWGWDSRDPLYR
jgi:ribosomal protein L2